MGKDAEQTVIDVEWSNRNGPIRLFDAHGNEIRWCFRANLLTGECDCYELGSDGKPLIDRATGDVRRVSVAHPAPLRWEFIKDMVAAACEPEPDWQSNG